MKQVTLMVTDETARQLEKLLHTGSVSARRGGTAYQIAHLSRPIKGERWLSIGDSTHEQWARLPGQLRCG